MNRSDEDYPRQYWLCLGLALLILIPYCNSFTAALLFDSETLIREDPRLRELSRINIEQILTRNYWWPSQESNLYRPLTTFSYFFNYAVLGNREHPAGYHVINSVLHWINACLVLSTVRRLAGRLDVAALAASIFAVHPINTEAVTNVVGRADLLATSCVLFGGWCYMRGGDAGARKKYWLALTGVIACLGVLAKENAVMIVVFTALFDFVWRWPSQQTDGRPERLKAGLKELRLTGYLALIPAFTLFLLIRRWVDRSTVVFQQEFVDNPLVGSTPFQGFMTAMGVVGRYLKLLVFPRTLSSDYSFNQIPLYGTHSNFTGDALALGSVVVVVLLIAGALWLRTRQQFLSWGVLFLFLMMLPTSNLFLTIGSIMAERFLYLPSIGFCAIAALGLCRAGEALVSFAPPTPRLRAIFFCALPALVIGLFGIRTFLRNADWHDEIAFWKSTVAASPASFKAHLGYASAIWRETQRTKREPPEQAIDKAIAEAEVARQIVEPDPPIPAKRQNGTVYLELGIHYRVKGDLLDRSGRHNEAVQFYRKSVGALLKSRDLDKLANDASREFRLRHGVPPEEIADVGNFMVHRELGMTYAKLEQWKDCEMAGRYLEHIVPEEISGYALVGGARFNLGRPADAAVQYIAGLLLDPDNTQLWTNLRTVYEALDVEPNPVMREGTRSSLNLQIPLAHQHLNEGAVTVVRLLKEAKQFTRARELEDRFIQQYSVPPVLFWGS